MKEFPEASRIALNDVDDVMTGAPTIRELKEIQQQLSLLMRQGGFELHKWASNYIEISTTQASSVTFPKVDQTRILGMIWRPEKDQFVITWNECEKHHNYTKRIVLSEIAKLYLLCPISILGKNINAGAMKYCWLSLGWYAVRTTTREMDYISQTTQQLNQNSIRSNAMRSPVERSRNGTP